MTSFITLKGEFKTDLEPDFIKNNQDLIKHIFKKPNFAFNDFNFYQNTINCDIQTPDIYLPSILPELFMPNRHQADFTRLLYNMHESNTRIHLAVQSLNTVLPEYLDQDVDLISNSLLELKAVNIHTYTDLDTEYDLISNNYTQGISLRDNHDLKENRMILLNKIAKPISQLQSVQKLGLTNDEIIKRIVKYVNSLSKYDGGLLYEHYKTPSKAIMWFYEGLHSEFE